MSDTRVTHAVNVEGLSKKFGRRQAVDDVSLQVHEGEIYGLLGHNGAGKSTIIGSLLGQIYPDKGTVRIFGSDIQSERNRALGQVGAIFETPCFYDYLSGWDNLMLFVSLSGRVEKKEVLEVLDQVRLNERVHDRVGTYSHGMRQRLALAQALLPRPRLMILDEPADGLDPEGILENREHISRLNREMGMTIILCSHQLHEVEQLCHRVAVLKEGRLVFEGDWRLQAEGENVLDLDSPARHELLSRLLAMGFVHGSEAFPQLSEGVEFKQILAEIARFPEPVRRVEMRHRTLEELYAQWSVQANRDRLTKVEL
ncbi:MAG: ABC transporter ATP-binding protein [Candidatus Methylacidiphilales bacterium]